MKRLWTRAGITAVARLAVVLLPLAGCSERTARAPVATTAAPAARAQAMIDAGNRAYEAGDFALAAKRYAAAAVHQSDDPAAFFGLGMALARLGRDEEARVAYARARELARGPQP